MIAIDAPTTRATLRLVDAALIRALARLDSIAPSAPLATDLTTIEAHAQGFWRRLVEACPVIAPVDQEPTKPLKVGIREDLLARFPDASADTVRRFLSTYCGSPSYRRLCIVGAPRFNLDGVPCGSVTEREASYAAKPRHEVVSPTITDGGSPDVAEEAASPADGRL